MRQNQAETRRHNVAKRSMTKEAKQLSGLIAGLRQSLDGDLQGADRAPNSPAPRWAFSWTTTAMTSRRWMKPPRYTR